MFGTGSGWAERDYEAYGHPFGTAGSRLDDLARDLPVIRERWAVLNPPPVRRIPILIGGAGERKTLRIVAEYADVRHGFVPAEGLPHELDVLQRHADEVGRDVSGIEIGNELRDRSQEDAQALLDQGVRLFTIGLDQPEIDWAPVQRWLAWRDARNA